MYQGNISTFKTEIENFVASIQIIEVISYQLDKFVIKQIY